MMQKQHLNKLKRKICFLKFFLGNPVEIALIGAKQYEAIRKDFNYQHFDVPLKVFIRDRYKLPLQLL